MRRRKAIGVALRSSFSVSRNSRILHLMRGVMVERLHEIWENEDGLPGCCLAGTEGEGFRRLIGQKARLIQTFWAGSHFDAMITYNRLLGRESYTTDHSSDFEPYPPAA